jgi:hypothetical protein
MGCDRGGLARPRWVQQLPGGGQRQRRDELAGRFDLVALARRAILSAMLLIWLAGKVSDVENSPLTDFDMVALAARGNYKSFDKNEDESAVLQDQGNLNICLDDPRFTLGAIARRGAPTWARGC